MDIKFSRSQNVVKEYKKGVEHKLILTQEERKLNENAMEVLKVRQKRLDNRKKLEIMSTQKRAEDNITQVKSVERELAEARPL